MHLRSLYDRIIVRRVTGIDIDYLIMKEDDVLAVEGSL